MQCRMIDGAGHANLCRRKAGGLGVSITIKGGIRKDVVAWPKSATAHFVRVGFPHHAIWQIRHLPRMFRCNTARKSRDCEIKATPEKVNGATFANKMGAKNFENIVGPNESLPKSISVL